MMRKVCFASAKERERERERERGREREREGEREREKKERKKKVCSKKEKGKKFVVLQSSANTGGNVVEL